MRHRRHIWNWIIGKLMMIRDFVNSDTEIGKSIDPYLRARSTSEDFIVRLAPEVKKVINRKKFRPPGERIFIPGHYIIFLSSAIDHFNRLIETATL